MLEMALKYLILFLQLNWPGVGRWWVVVSEQPEGPGAVTNGCGRQRPKVNKYERVDDGMSGRLMKSWFKYLASLLWTLMSILAHFWFMAKSKRVQWKNRFGFLNMKWTQCDFKRNNNKYVFPLIIKLEDTLFTHPHQHIKTEMKEKLRKQYCWSSSLINIG